MAPTRVVLEKSDCERVAIRTPKHALPQETIMKRLYAPFAIGLLSVLTAASAGADSNSYDQRLGGANRIVGLWATEGHLGPCNGTPVITVLNTLLFQAGGTVVDNPRFPPGGAPNASGLYARNQGLGTWSYDPVTHKYFLHLQFDNFIDGVYDGYSTVDRELVLSQEGLLASGPVRSDRFKADGSLLMEVCGQAVSSRL